MGNSYQVIVTPLDNAEGNVTLATNPLGGAKDANGNNLVAVSANQAFDTKGPTVNSISIPQGSGVDKVVSEASTVTIQFSEAVTGFDANDISVSSGAISNLKTLMVINKILRQPIHQPAK